MFPAEEALDCIHLVEVGPLLVGPNLLPDFTSPKSVLDLGVFYIVIEYELFNPVPNEQAIFFGCNEVIFVGQMPVVASVVASIYLCLVDIGGILWVEEHKGSGVLAVAIVDIVFGVVGDVEQPR